MAGGVAQVAEHLYLLGDPEFNRQYCQLEKKSLCLVVGLCLVTFL
jgi:hypothetical protein